MRILLASAAAILTGALTIATAQDSAGPVDDGAVTRTIASDYQVSARALATAAADAGDYEFPMDAVRAGDMAAFITRIASEEEMWGEGFDIDGIVLALDRIADEDYDGARIQLNAASGSPFGDPIIDFIDAWIYALEGDIDAAIQAHRGADGDLPGLTGDLSLAAMLESAGRNEEALAVYTVMTPNQIEAPEHQFDARGIMFAHIQMVIARRTLLLRRLGRVEEAQDVYRQLAEAEPEQAARYAAAMEALETGRGLDDEALTSEAAFARAFSDLSLSLWQRRIIQRVMLGQRSRGLDEQRAVFDQLALLINPDDEDLRDNVINMLQSEALFAGAAHVASSAPEPTAALQISAAQSHLRNRDEDATRLAIESALELTDADDRIGILAGAVGIHALMGDEDRAIELASEAISLSRNDAEAAMTSGLKSEILQQFGHLEEAVPFARAAREADDTHGRRMYLANILGRAGHVEEGLQMIRRERLRRPNDPYMLNTLGYFLISHTDQVDEGYQILYRSNALARNDPYIADSLGWALYQLGHFEDALRLILQSRAELAPQVHWEIEHHLGDIYWHLGQEDEARAAWEIALDEFPPYATAQELREKIANGITTPAPERQPLPRVSIDDGETLQRKT